MLEPDKGSLTPSISPGFYRLTGKGGPSNLVIRVIDFFLHFRSSLT
jgi:hypothetical protein